MNANTFNVIINRLRAFAAGHELIQAFTNGQGDTADIEKEGLYPYMHAIPGTISGGPGFVRYSFRIDFWDLVRDVDNKTDYQDEAISDCGQLAFDLLAELYNSSLDSLFGEGVGVADGWSIEPAIQEGSNNLTGVSFTFGLDVDKDWDACDIPADWSPGSSAGGSAPYNGPLIFARSVVNTAGTVTLVGDVASPEANYYYGTNSEGVRGWYSLPEGGVVTWESITGKPSEFPPSGHTHQISDVVDLQDELDGKETAGAASAALTSANSYTDNAISNVTPASIGAEVSGAAAAAQAAAVQRSNHTGTQLASTISDFLTALLASVLTGLGGGSDTAILATDALLVAFANLQAQITATKARVLALESAIREYRLTSAFSITTDTETNVTGFTIPVEANTYYRIRIGLFTQCSGTSGLKLGIKVPTCNMRVSEIGRTSSFTAMVNLGGIYTGNTGLMPLTYNTAAQGAGMVMMDISLAVGGTPGNFQLTLGSVNAAQTSQVREYSAIQIIKVVPQ